MKAQTSNSVPGTQFDKESASSPTIVTFATLLILSIIATHAGNSSDLRSRERNIVLIPSDVLWSMGCFVVRSSKLLNNAR